jgi:hypothetical protein
MDQPIDISKKLTAARLYLEHEKFRCGRRLDVEACLGEIERFYGSDTKTALAEEIGWEQQPDTIPAAETDGHQNTRIYLQLLHGRKHPDENLDDWGADGPCLGPFDWFHATYFTTFTLGTLAEGDVWDLRDSVVGDLLYYDGTYYGDWELSTCPKTSTIEPFDAKKSIPPK